MNSQCYYEIVKQFKDIKEGFTLKEFALFVLSLKTCENFLPEITIEEVSNIDWNVSDKNKLYVGDRTRNFIETFNSLGNRIPVQSPFDSGQKVINHLNEIVPIFLSSGFPGGKILEIIPAESRYWIFSLKEKKELWQCSLYSNRTNSIATGELKAISSKMETYSKNKTKEIIKIKKKQREVIDESDTTDPLIKKFDKVILEIETKVIIRNQEALSRSIIDSDFIRLYALRAEIKEKIQNNQNKEIKSLKKQIKKLKKKGGKK